jgi:hypothetical protein
MILTRKRAFLTAATRRRGDAEKWAFDPILTYSEDNLLGKNELDATVFALVCPDGLGASEAFIRNSGGVDSI